MSKVGLGKYAELEITNHPEYGERGQSRHFERTREGQEQLGVIERQKGILVMTQKSPKAFSCKNEIENSKGTSSSHCPRPAERTQAAVKIQRTYRAYRAIRSLKQLERRIISAFDPPNDIRAAHAFLRARSAEFSALRAFLNATPHTSDHLRVVSTVKRVSETLRRSLERADCAERERQESRVRVHVHGPDETRRSVRRSKRGFPKLQVDHNDKQQKRDEAPPPGPDNLHRASSEPRPIPANSKSSPEILRTSTERAESTERVREESRVRLHVHGADETRSSPSSSKLSLPSSSSDAFIDKHQKTTECGVPSTSSGPGGHTGNSPGSTLPIPIPQPNSAKQPRQIPHSTHSTVSIPEALTHNNNIIKIEKTTHSSASAQHGRWIARFLAAAPSPTIQHRSKISSAPALPTIYEDVEIVLSY